MGMSTKAYLSQIERLDRMIQSKISEIAKLKSIALSVTSQLKDIDVQMSVEKDKVGSFVVKIISLEEEVNRLIDRRVHIIGQIDSIKDVKMYEVLTQRYVEYKPIKEITLGRIKSDRQVKRILSKAHEKFEKMFGHEYL